MRGDTCAPRPCRPSPRQSQRSLFMARDLPDDHPTSWPTGAFAAPTAGPRTCPLPRGRRRLLRWPGAAGGEVCGSTPSPSNCRRLTSTIRSGVPVQAAHDALPLPGSPGRRRVRHRPAHRHSFLTLLAPTTFPACRSARKAANGSMRRSCPAFVGTAARAAALDQRLFWRRRTGRSTAAAASAMRSPSSATATSMAGGLGADHGRPGPAAEISDDLVHRLHDPIPETDV